MMIKPLIIFVILFAVMIASAQSESEIVETIKIKAIEADVDADLAVAIAKVESSLNTKAVGPYGELGLFQLRPEYHKLNGTVSNNIEVGIAYLKWLKEFDNGKSGDAWFVRYNVGPYRNIKFPAKQKYYKKVMRELSNIKTQSYLLAEK